jgi:hypothetical protein
MGLVISKGLTLRKEFQCETAWQALTRCASGSAQAGGSEPWQLTGWHAPDPMGHSANREEQRTTRLVEWDHRVDALAYEKITHRCRSAIPAE